MNESQSFYLSNKKRQRVASKKFDSLAYWFAPLAFETYLFRAKRWEMPICTNWRFSLLGTTFAFRHRGVLHYVVYKKGRVRQALKS